RRGGVFILVLDLLGRDGPLGPAVSLITARAARQNPGGCEDDNLICEFHFWSLSKRIFVDEHASCNAPQSHVWFAGFANVTVAILAMGVEVEEGAASAGEDNPSEADTSR